MRQTTMRILFDGWNADNLRAREAYYERMNELEKPKMCRRRLHVRPPGQHGGCRECRSARERLIRSGQATSTSRWRLTEEQKTQVVALYTEELMPPNEIAPLFKISRNTIYSMLIERGAKVRNYSEAYQAMLERRRRTTQPEGNKISA